MVEQEFFSQIEDIAKSLWESYQILPSIAAAQAAHESAFGTSGLAENANNYFGIKASGDCNAEGEEPTGRNDDWEGGATCYLTWEVVNGEDVQVIEPFRVYESAQDSFNDYAEFLQAERYAAVIGEENYQNAAEALLEAGYATDPNYATALIETIEEYNLDEWDTEVLNNNEDNGDNTGNHLIALGHGYDNNNNYDPGGIGIDGIQEAELLRGDLYDSLQRYAEEAETNIEFYDQNLLENNDAINYVDYDSVTELHFDAVDDPNASGGHVILRTGAEPNEMDIAFRDMIEEHFGLAGYPEGFDSTRTDLGNVNLFTEYGTNYRLLELGFITNPENLNYIQSNYDEVARDIIEIISGTEISTPPTNPDPEPDPDPTSISDIQVWLNETYGAELEVDNIYGPLTVNAVIQGVQTEMNLQYGTNLVIDGIFGSATQAAWLPLMQGAQGNITRLVQAQLIGLNYEVNGFDGVFGVGLESAVRAYQADSGLVVDGIVGTETAYSLFNELEGTGTPVEPTPTITHEIQQWLNRTYNTQLEVDGIFGPATSQAIVIGLQTEMNLQYGSNLVIDGVFGSNTRNAWLPVQQGVQGNITRLIQAKLILLGYEVNGFDGIFGEGLTAAVRRYQANNGLVVDGIVGVNTATQLFS